MADEFGQDLAVIGKFNADPHGDHLVTGKFDFAADHDFPGMLYGAIMGSNVSHAKILSMDTSAAEALDGVKAVITYAENPRWSDIVLMYNMPIAAVAATDPDIAERALELIKVEYEVRPHVVDPDDALKEGAPVTGVFAGANISATPVQVIRGDVEAGFKEAAGTFEMTIGWQQYYQHNQIETDSTTAYWAGDDAYCYSKNQNPFSQQSSVSSALKMPRHRVHLFTHGTGGGYGGGGGSLCEVEALLLSKKAGAPVKIIKSRRHQVTHNNHQYGCKAWIKVGYKSDGSLTAIDSIWWSDGGRNGARGTFVNNLQYSWKCANLRSLTHAIGTNKGTTGPYRCVAHPAGGWVCEMVLDELAKRLNMNPMALRRKIMVTADMADQDTKTPYASYILLDLLEECNKGIGYEAKYHLPGTKTLPDGRLHGVGISAHIDGHGGGPSGVRGCIINMTEDGKCLYNQGMSRCQSMHPLSQAIIAETLGLKYEDVRVGDWGNTDVCAEGGQQTGSTGTMGFGAAAMRAAEDARAQIFVQAAKTLGVPEADLDARDSKVFSKTDPTKTMTHAQVMAKIATPVIGRGVRWDPQLRKERGGFPVGTPCVTRGCCGAAAEVAVDPETGEVEILDFINVVDYGRVITKQGAESQIINGLDAMLNQLFMYEQVYDKNTGAPLTFDHVDNKLVTSLDIPQKLGLKFKMMESIDVNGPYGAKGVGEPCTSSYSAIANAICNAIGSWILTVPYTPQKILQALGKA